MSKAVYDSGDFFVLFHLMFFLDAGVW